MRRAAGFLALILLLPSPNGASAAARVVPAEPGALAAAIAEAQPGDLLRLAPGRHLGAVVIDRPLTLDGGGAALVDGQNRGSVISIEAADVTVRGLQIVGSGSAHQTIDAGVKLTPKATRARVEDNRLEGNLYGIDIHGGKDSLVRGNIIVGRQDHRMNDRGNGVYVWNAPGARVEANDIRYGRDGIFTNSSKKNSFVGNLFRDLRFAVHYMYTNDSEVRGNVSIGNHLGYALMFSDRIKVEDNLSLRDRDHGLMLNYANRSDVSGNLVRGGAEKCAFIYNAHSNLVVGNRFEGCDIGIHFTAGSERNAITGNAFVNNRTQVKYVGTRDVEWSFEGRGNYWSDHAAFDLNGDGLADSSYRPNDLMDHILWSQPAARLLLGSPAVQLVRWSQASFPATLPGGVRDSHPLMKPLRIEVPAKVADMERSAAPPWRDKELL